MAVLLAPPWLVSEGPTVFYIFRVVLFLCLCVLCFLCVPKFFCLRVLCFFFCVFPCLCSFVFLFLLLPTLRETTASSITSYPLVPR